MNLSPRFFHEYDPSHMVNWWGAGSVQVEVLNRYPIFPGRRLKFELSFHSITQFKVNGVGRERGLCRKFIIRIYNTKAKQN